MFTPGCCRLWSLYAVVLSCPYGLCIDFKAYFPIGCLVMVKRAFTVPL